MKKIITLAAIFLMGLNTAFCLDIPFPAPIPTGETIVGLRIKLNELQQNPDDISATNILAQTKKAFISAVYIAKEENGTYSRVIDNNKVNIMVLNQDGNPIYSFDQNALKNIKVLNEELVSAGEELGLVWADVKGDDEARVTIRAFIRKVASIFIENIDIQNAWVEAVYSNLAP